ncbi:MAG: DUF86 domain-containing protein [Mangrovibacterium sp.]
MKDNKDIFRLEHMLESIAKIQSIIQILHSFETFEQRWIEQDALIRNFEVLGEVANHVSQATKDKYPDVAWREMRDMRIL